MKVSVEKIKIEMSANESEMLLSALRHVNWKEFSNDVDVVNVYRSFVGNFIDVVNVEIR